jgi:hypothetical protein
VHHDHYRVLSREGLAMLFRQFDDRASGRSPADVAGAYQGLHPSLAKVKRRTAKIGIEGIAWWRRHVEGLPVPMGDSQYTLFGIESLHPFLIWLDQVMSSKTSELERSTVVAAMYGTFVRNEQDARTFWSSVARGGDEFDDTNPTTVLDNWLKAYVENPKGQKPLKPTNFYQGSIYCWNAYRDGKQLTAIKSDAKKGLHQIAE